MGTPRSSGHDNVGDWMSRSAEVDGWGSSIVEVFLFSFFFFFVKSFWENIVMGSCSLLTHRGVAAEVVILW